MAALVETAPRTAPIMFQNIVITGASSGIGKALALRYARPGVVLGLLGRNRERLGDVAGLCRGLGAEPETGVLDIADRPQMQAWLEDFDRRFPVDLLVANAGILGGEMEEGRLEPADESYAQFETNITGVLNTLHPLLPKMVERRGGHICIVSSIAGFIPLAHSPSYSASKSATLNYGLALRAALRPHGVNVTVICPGLRDHADDRASQRAQALRDAGGRMRRADRQGAGAQSCARVVPVLVCVADPDRRPAAGQRPALDVEAVPLHRLRIAGPAARIPTVICQTRNPARNTTGRGSP